MLKMDRKTSWLRRGSVNERLNVPSSFVLDGFVDYNLGNSDGTEVGEVLSL